MKFYFINGGVSFHYTEDNFKFVESTLSRIRSANLPFWARSLVIAGAVVNKISYGSEIGQLDDTQERNLKNAVTGAVWGSPSTKRTLGVLYTVITKGHILDISQSVLTSRWVKICRTLRNNPALGDLLHRNFSLRKNHRIQKTGPGEALSQSARRLQLSYETGTSICCEGTVHDLLSCKKSKLGHDIRNLGRMMVWKQVRTDARRVKRALGDPLPHLHDLGEQNGVHREDTMKLYSNSNDSTFKGVLRTILCNGVWTASARAKLPKNDGMSPPCQYCNTGQVETLRHIWWSCPTW